MEIWILNIGETESARQLATKQWNERVVVASGGEESNPQAAAQNVTPPVCTYCGYKHWFRDPHFEESRPQHLTGEWHVQQTKSASAPTPKAKRIPVMLNWNNQGDSTRHMVFAEDVEKLEHELYQARQEIQRLSGQTKQDRLIGNE